MRTPDWGGMRIQMRLVSLSTPHRRYYIVSGGYKQLRVVLTTYRETELKPPTETLHVKNAEMNPSAFLN